MTKGRRVYPGESGYPTLGPGDYGKDKDGQWWCKPPIEERGMAGLLTEHTVTEHEDGTITVSPSIFISRIMGDKTITWHGYLERGIWREV